MMKVHKVLITTGITSVFSIITGCETQMSETACNSANWEEVGYKDGLSGYSQDTFKDRAEQCARYNIDSNIDLYRKGWQSALTVYCTPENGLRAGRNGQKYYGICPPDKDLAFRSAYSEGRKYASAKDSLASAQRYYEYNLSERRSLTYRLDDLYEDRINATTDQERHRLDKEIKDCRRQIRDLDYNTLRQARERIETAQRALYAAERDYERLSRTLKSDQLIPLK